MGKGGDLPPTHACGRAIVCASANELNFFRGLISRTDEEPAYVSGNGERIQSGSCAADLQPDPYFAGEPGENTLLVLW